MCSFLILVLIALLLVGGEIAMRVRLTTNEDSSDRLVWWRRGGDEVAASYRKQFPDSRLPFLRSLVFWLLFLWLPSP